MAQNELKKRDSELDIGNERRKEFIRKKRKLID